MIRVEIAKHSGVSRAGSWRYVLYCTFCADGTVSLREELAGDYPTYKPKGVRGIRTAQQFLDGVGVVCAITSSADHIDYDHVCSIVAEHRPNLAADLLALTRGDKEVDLPPEIEKAINAILLSPRIYPNVEGSLVGMRSTHYNTRSAPINHYIANGKLPEGSFQVGGHVIHLNDVRDN